MYNHSLFLSVLFGVGCAYKTDTDSGTSNAASDAAAQENGQDEGTTDGSAGSEDGTDGGTESGGDDDDVDGDLGGLDDGSDGSTDGGGSDDAGGTSDAGDTDGGSSEIEIAGGYWNTELSNTYTITSETISEVNGPPVATTYVWTIGAYHNGDRYVIAQNPAGHWTGEGWTRFDWAVDGSTVYLCATKTDAPDEATALAEEAASWTGDPDEGCPNLVDWMTLTPS